MFVAESGCHTYYFTHHAGSTHHTYRTQSYMGAAHIAACHKEVVHIARIETAIGNGIRMNPTMHRSRLEFIAGKTYTIHAVGEVKVDAPGSGERSILVRHILVYIVL